MKPKGGSVWANIDTHCAIQSQTLFESPFRPLYFNRVFHYKSSPHHTALKNQFRPTPWYCKYVGVCVRVICKSTMFREKSGSKVAEIDLDGAGQVVDLDETVSR